MAKDRNYRDRFVSTVAGLDLRARLYIAPVKGISQRQARSRCLTVMVADLIAAGVTNLYLESCDQDKADRIALAKARAQAAVDDSAFHFDHRRAHEEPMLWVPDVIAWAYGKDRRWRAKVDHLITDVVTVAT